MKSVWITAAVAALCLAPAAPAAGAERAARSFEVPYRLTVPKHVLVRAKINGKGPYNFILDTGAPALFVAAPLCKKLAIAADGKGWGTFDRFEIEGGLVLKGLSGRVETPFQLEGMNGLGLAGAELHGIIGYNVLARYRIALDFTSDKMTWTELNFTPAPPAGLGGRRGAAGGLEVIGSVMKVLGALLGKKPNHEVVLRGFLGMEVADGEESPVIRAVLPDGPAGRAGVRAGDRLTHFQGRGVYDTSDVLRFARKLAAGDPVKLTVRRGEATQEITFKAGEGL